MAEAQGKPTSVAIEKVKLVNFDLQSYAQLYKGHARVNRLSRVADFAAGLEGEAVRLLLAEVQRGADVKLYKYVAERCASPVDQQWCVQIEKDAMAAKERLDAELNAAKASLMKDEIRRCHTALGDLYYNRNDLNSAFKCYVRTRDYCSSSAQIIEMCMNVIRTSLELGNFSHVVNYVSKAEQTPDLPVLASSKLKIATGLSNLHNRKFKVAARNFLDAGPEMGGNTYSDVLSNADVGLYAGTCALATFDRNELKRFVISNSRIKSLLDLTPALSSLIHAFYNCRYTEALRLLEQELRPRLMIDPFLAEHASFLCRQIRNKAIVQFFTPYSSVDMKIMAAAFNTSVGELEQELKNLIIESEIAARIDSFNQVLVAKQVDQRSRMFSRALETGRDHSANMRESLLRMDLVMQDFSVKVPRRGGQGGGQGGGGQAASAQAGGQGRFK